MQSKINDVLKVFKCGKIMFNIDPYPEWTVQGLTASFHQLLPLVTICWWLKWGNEHTRLHPHCTDVDVLNDK